MSTEITNVEQFYSNDASKLQDYNFAMISEVKKKDDEPIDGIDIIMNMVKSGKLDPWNIDLTDLADKYLVEFAKLKTVNLKYTGRTILFLSVLLKMKSNVLAGINYDQFEIPEEQPEYAEDDGDDYSADYDNEPTVKSNVISLEEALTRRTSVHLTDRKRVVTLQDLINQLAFYEKLDKQVELKRQLESQRKRAKSYVNYTPQKIAEMSQDDYILEVLPKMKANLDMIFKNETKIELESLTLLGFSKMTAYMALLFLVTETDYVLSQEKFYDKLYIEKCK